MIWCKVCQYGQSVCVCVYVCVCVCVFSSLRGKESEFFDQIHKLNTKVVKQKKP